MPQITREIEIILSQISRFFNFLNLLRNFILYLMFKPIGKCAWPIYFNRDTCLTLAWLRPIEIWLILNNMMLSLSFPANIKYSPKTLILFFFIGVQTKFFLRGCWTRLDIINRRLGATSSSWVHCTFSQTLCCKNDFRNVSRILSLSCLVHLVEYARIHSFL